MKAIVLVVILALLTIMIFANDYAPGNIVFHSSEKITITNSSSGLVTDLAWVNSKISEFKIYRLKLLGEDILPPDLLSSRLYYLAVFDTTYSVESVVSSFAAEPSVNWAEPNYTGQFDMTSDDWYSNLQWNLDILGLQNVWNMENAEQIDHYVVGDPNVVVAVLDSGIDLGYENYPSPHPDLIANIWQDNEGYFGWNPFALTGDEGNPVDGQDEHIPQDRLGHGTLVSGIISGKSNNGQGIASIAGGWSGNRGCQIMPVKVGYTDLLVSTTVYEGLIYAYVQGARVINMSFQLQENNLVYSAIHDIYTNAGNFPHSPIMVASAGNDSANQPHFPSDWSEVISVAATNFIDTITNYSNFSKNVDICAPGGSGWLENGPGIISTSPQDDSFIYHIHPSIQMPILYAGVSGTSFSAPHVAGVAALIISYYNSLNQEISNEELTNRLLGSTDDIFLNNITYSGLLGSGRLNAYKAITDAPHPCVYLQEIQFTDANNNLVPEILQTNETYFFKVNLKNVWLPANNVWCRLSTDDPDITLSNSELYWSVIDTGCSLLNTRNIDVSIIGGLCREVVFTLTVGADGIPEKVYTFTKRIWDSTYGTFNLPLVADEGLNQHQVCKDIDWDGFDEVIVSTDMGRVFIINENQSYTSMASGHLMKCVPAVGDVNSDGQYEIISGSFENAILNYVHVWDAQGGLISTYSVQGNVTNITISDVNGDGQPDIIATLNESSEGIGMNGFVVINQHTQTMYPLDTTYKIKDSISASDMDNDGIDELIALLKDGSGWITEYMLIVYDVSANFTFSEVFIVQESESASSTIWSSPFIADLDEDGTKEIICSILDGGAEKIVVYRYGTHSIIWHHDIALNLRSPIERDIAISDFDSNSPGLEILVFSKDRVLLSSSGVVLINVEDIEEATSALGAYPIIFDSNVDNLCEYYLVYDFGFWSIGPDLITNSTIIFPTSAVNWINGASLIKTSSSSNAICLTSYQGKVIYIPKDFNPNSAPIYKQFLNSSTHTGNYTQPLPEIISAPITAKHDICLERNTEVTSDGLLNLMRSGLRIEADPQVMIASKGTIIGNNAGNQEVKITGTCFYTTSGYWKGIFMGNRSTSNLNFFRIENADIGISYIDTGHHRLFESKLLHNNVGMEVYDSTPILFQNHFYNNLDYGIILHHFGTPYMGHDPQEICGENAIYSNPVGMLIVESQPYIKEGHNDFDNSQFNCITQHVHQISAPKNWWGSVDPDDIIQKFSEPDMIMFDPWDLNANAVHDAGLGQAFDLAMQHFLYDDFSLAIPLFYQVLNDSIENDEDFISAKTLLTCYEKIENLTEFETYLNQRLSGSLSDAMRKCMSDVLSLIKRICSEYSYAINHYEAILDNSPTLEDSCYAVIDLGNTYLESDSKAVGRYAVYKPKSLSEHIETTHNLLKLLQGEIADNDSSIPPARVQLEQNYPNPFNPSTTISFSLPTDNKIELVVYNTKGQKVITLLNNSMEKGFHRIVWNGLDENHKPVSTGIYFYKLTYGKSSLIKKCLLLK